MTPQQTRQAFEAAGQGHVFQFFDSLSASQQSSFIKTLEGIDVQRVNRIFKTSTAPKDASAKDTLSPLPEAAFDSLLTADKTKIQAWEELGLKAIAKNQVGIILLAGGQGTRIGSSAPKGCYDIQLPSHKSLFQLQAERIARIQTLAQPFAAPGIKVVIPWYVMTSGPTRAPTESFFQEHKYFGLSKDQIMFFEQGVLPAFTMDGKIFLETKDQLALAPDGNGGIYAALRSEGVLADLEKRGIPYIHAYCVDNCLVKQGGPIFVGYCISKKADCAAKVVPKRHPDEAAGVVCLRNGKFSVVEYSEIDKETAHARKPDGSLLYNAANIANHFYTTDFLKRIEEFESELEYHIAKKKIKHVDLATGEQVSPSTPNGIKLELFIFDVFPFTKNMAVLEVDRAEEFSPLKNAPGCKDGDSPDTSRADIMSQHVRFVEKAGGKVVAGADGSKVLEISPLVSYAGEALEVLQNVQVTCPQLTSNDQDLKALMK